MIKKIKDSLVNGRSTSFPTSLDTDQSNATEALQAKVGVDSSSVTTSLEYRVTNGISDSLTVDTDTLIVDSTNNRVGIGTTSPRTPLEIQGTSSGSVDEVLLLAADGNAVAGSGARLHLSGGNATQRSAYVEGVNTGGATNAHALTFGTSASSSDPVERMRIDASGNVGIGDSTPSYTLDVNGDINATGDLLVNGTSINRLPPVDVTTSSTLALADAGTWIAESGAGSRTLTIPLNSSVAFPIGTQILVSRSTASAVTIAAASGVALYSTLGTGNVTIGNVNGFVTLLKYTADAWYAIGDVA